MAVIWDGKEVTTLEGENRSGKDMRGQPVVIRGSHEAIQDFGWPTVWQAGETKYANGNFELIGDVRVVSVTTLDCEVEIKS